jgi:hypothetical protein
MAPAVALGIADGQHGVGGVGVEVVEGVVHAGGEGLALSPNPGSYLTDAPDTVIMNTSEYRTERTGP